MIIVARERAGDGKTWRRADVTDDRATVASGVPTAFISLIDSVVASPLATDIVVSTRCIDAIIAAGDQLGVPADFTLTLLCPSGRYQGDDGWSTLVLAPGSDGFIVIPGGAFTKRALKARLEKIFGEPALPRDAIKRDWEALFAKREVWIKHGLRAIDLCPTVFPQRDAPPPPAEPRGPGVPPAVDTRTAPQHAAAATRAERSPNNVVVASRAPKAKAAAKPRVKSPARGK